MILYCNHDLRTIRLLLREVGVHYYEQAIRIMKANYKRVDMKGCYLDANQDYLNFGTRYPLPYLLNHIGVDQINNIPAKGWERINVAG